MSDDFLSTPRPKIRDTREGYSDSATPAKRKIDHVSVDKDRIASFKRVRMLGKKPIDLGTFVAEVIGHNIDQQIGGKYQGLQMYHHGLPDKANLARPNLKRPELRKLQLFPTWHRDFSMRAGLDLVDLSQVQCGPFKLQITLE